MMKPAFSDRVLSTAPSILTSSNPNPHPAFSQGVALPQPSSRNASNNREQQWIH